MVGAARPGYRVFEVPQRRPPVKHVIVVRLSLAVAVIGATAVVAAMSASSPVVGNVWAQEKPAPKPAPTVDRVGYPEGYETWQQLYVFDRPLGKQVRVIYGNPQAAAASPAKGPNEVFPYGSILVMEAWRAKEDAQGNVLLDDDGRYQRDQLTGTFVMRKEPGFGDAYQTARSGEWEYVAFRPDKQYATPPEQTNVCSLCHQDAGATKDWVMRANLYFYNQSGAAPMVAPGLLPNGQISIQSYTFLSDPVRVKKGTTISWTNDEPIAHTVTAGDKSWDSGRIGPGGAFSRTFDQVGAFDYVCSLHNNMKAQVVVED